MGNLFGKEKSMTAKKKSRCLNFNPHMSKATFFHCGLGVG